MNTHEELWAKFDADKGAYPLLAHLLDSAAVAGALYDHWLRTGLQDFFTKEFGTDAKRKIMFIVGTHDVGKALPHFQCQRSKHGAAWERIRQGIEDSGFYHPLHRSSPLIDKRITLARRHEQWSAFSVKENLPNSTDCAQRTWRELIHVGHHGRFKFEDRYAQFLINEYKSSGWLQAERDLIDSVALGCGVEIKNLPEAIENTTTLLLSGLTVLADRIASGERFVESGMQLLNEHPSVLERPADYLKSRALAALNRVNTTVGVYRPWKSPLDAQKAILGDFKPRPIQQAALAAGDGLWSLMADTGSGKTEAALLRHSTKAERLVFLLPTQATSNAIMRRVQKAYEGTPNVASLAHGLASMEDFYDLPLSVFDDKFDDETDKANPEPENGAVTPTGLYPSSFVKAGAARLFAPVSVGTVDQALAAALPGKWIHFRLLALANAHIVIDEVHTLDPYQTKLLEEILPWLAATGARVTFLTATLPNKHREALLRSYTNAVTDIQPVKFPAIDTVEVDEDKQTQITTSELQSVPKTVNIDLMNSSFASLVTNEVQWYTQARSEHPNARIGIICNTVARAQQVAEAISETGGDVVLLHSRMTAEHRRIAAEQLERLIGKNGKGTGVTVVGTQAIEASLDIDLDLLATEICPAPSLIQRLGRLWRRGDQTRHERIGPDSQQTLTVFTFESDANWQYRPYLRAEISRTAKWLRDHRELHMPQDAQEFIDSASVTLDDASEDSDFEALADEMLKAMKADGRRAPINQAMSEDAKVAIFDTLTSVNPPDETQTRLIDEGSQYNLILGSSTDSIPGAWRGAASDLLSIKAGSQEGKAQLREALRASIPLRLSEKQKSLLSEKGLVGLREARSVLGRYYFLPQAEAFYDRIAGFRFPSGGAGEVR